MAQVIAIVIVFIAMWQGKRRNWVLLTGWVFPNMLLNMSTVSPLSKNPCTRRIRTSIASYIAT